jgi:hypothetical protein
MLARVQLRGPKLTLPRIHQVALVARGAVWRVKGAGLRNSRAADVDDRNRIAVAVNLWCCRRNALRDVCERAVFLHLLMVP